MMSMDASSFHTAVLAEVLPQVSLPVVASRCSMPAPIGPVNSKYRELASEEIDRTGLKSIPENAAELEYTCV